MYLDASGIPSAPSLARWRWRHSAPPPFHPRQSVCYFMVVFSSIHFLIPRTAILIARHPAPSELLATVAASYPPHEITAEEAKREFLLDKTRLANWASCRGQDDGAGCCILHCRCLVLHTGGARGKLGFNVMCWLYGFCADGERYDILGSGSGVWRKPRRHRRRRQDAGRRKEEARSSLKESLL